MFLIKGLHAQFTYKSKVISINENASEFAPPFYLAHEGIQSLSLSLLRASGVVFLTQKVKLEKEEKQNSSVNLSVL